MNLHDPVDNTQNRQLLVSTVRLLGHRAKQRFTIYRSSLFFFSLFLFSFYCFLFDFALLLYLALPGPEMFFSALLCVL